MNVLYLGAGMVAVATIALVLVFLASTTEPRGVAKSLALIEVDASARTTVRSELPARERLIEPLFDKTRALAGVLSPERHRRALDEVVGPCRQSRSLDRRSE